MASNLSRRLDALTKTALPGTFEVRFTDSAGRQAARTAIAAERDDARRVGTSAPNVLLVVFEDENDRGTTA
jgi:hypothetical protein